MDFAKDFQKKTCIYGISNAEKINGKDFFRTVFDCSKYYYDGNFNVVEIPEGINLYHGSLRLADNLVLIPVGKTYMDNLKNKGPEIDNEMLAVMDEPNDIQKLLSAYEPPMAGWFADPKVANAYSCGQPSQGENNIPFQHCCKDKNIAGLDFSVKSCVMVYKTKTPVKLILMDDPYNAFKLRKKIINLSHEDIIKIANFIKIARPNNYNYPKTTNDLIYYMDAFYGGDINSLIFDEVKESQIPLKRFNLYNKDGSHLTHFNRNSKYEWDIPFSVIICYIINKLSLKYAGYGSPSMATSQHTNPENKRNEFHMEIVLCNPVEYLTRDYDNPIDWQHNPKKNNYPSVLTNYINTIKNYAVINYKEYAGNLYENAIWALLYVEYIIYPNKDAIYDEWQDLLKNIYVDATESDASIISTIAFLHNFRYTQQCNYNNKEFASCDINDTIESNRGMIVGTDLLNTLSPNVTDKRKLNVFLYTYLNSTSYLNTFFHKVSMNNDDMNEEDNEEDNEGDNEGDFIKLIINIINIASIELLIYEYEPPNLKRFLNELVFTLLSVTISIFFTRISTNPDIKPLHNPDINKENNTVSINIPYFTNVSRFYPGNSIYYNNKHYIMKKLYNYMILFVNDDFVDRTLTEQIKTNQHQALKTDVYGIILYKLLTLTNVTTLLPITIDREIAQFRNLLTKISENEARVEDHVLNLYNNNNKDNYAQIISNEEIETQFENKFVHVNWDIFTAIKYEDYMKRIVLRLKYQLSNHEDLETIVFTDIHDRVSQILEILKPILRIIIEEYSINQYPNVKVYPPRYNHNSLNHLRSVYFCAIVLLNTSFISHNNLSNTDIFLILLCSMFKSIGRVNETSGNNGVNYDPSKYISIFPDQKVPDVSAAYSLYNYPIAPFTAISSVIQYQVLHEIHKSFNLTKSQYYDTIVYSLVITPSETDGLVETYGTNKNLNKLIDISGMLAIGHYLDHCRPTTGYGQLDTKDELNIYNGEKGTGQIWVREFLNRWKSPDFQSWLMFKEFIFNKQKDIFERSGFKPNVNKQSISIKKSWSKRCINEFDRNPTQRIIELYKNFSSAWNVIFNNTIIFENEK